MLSALGWERQNACDYVTTISQPGPNIRFLTHIVYGVNETVPQPHLETAN